MAIYKIRSALLTIVAIGVLLIPETQSAFAKGGGGHSGGGAAHVGGGRSGGGAAHVGGGRSGGSAHFRAASSGRVHGSKASHIGSSRVGSSRVGTAKSARNARNLSTAQTARNLSGTRNARSLANSRSGATRVNTANALAAGSRGALAGRAAWNHWGNPNWQSGRAWNGGWGGWSGGWGGWAGPVFWPYFFGNLLAFTFWPYPYFDPLWAYGDWFVWDALFWPGPYYGPAYAVGPGYDVYGGYAYDGRRRTRVARHAAPETTGSIPNQADIAESCGGIAPGLTDLPLDRIETTIRLTSEQRKALDDLKAATLRASDILKASCSSEVPLTPVDRLGAVEKRVDSVMQALGTVRSPLDNFYNSLNEDQRQRFAAMGASRARPTNAASGNDLASLCSRETENFAQLPVRRIEQAVKPTQQQLDAFEKLKAASAQAANQLHASCPARLPQTAMDRFDAMSKRLDAMSAAIKTVRPALADFYASLSDEQKARFNTLGPPATQRQG